MQTEGKMQTADYLTEPCYHFYQWGLKPSFHLRRKHKRKHNNSYFDCSLMVTCFMLQCSSLLNKWSWLSFHEECEFISPWKRLWSRHKHNFKDQNDFSFFLCLRLCLSLRGNNANEKHKQKNIYYTLWKHWIQVTLRLDSLEDSEDFACAFVCVEFRFHLDHPYCLRLCLRR